MFNAKIHAQTMGGIGRTYLAPHPLHQDHPPLPQDRPHLPQDHLPPPLGRSPSNASQKEREAMQRRPQLPFITVDETSENKM